MKSKKTNDAPNEKKSAPPPEGTPKDKNNDQPEPKPGVDLSQPWPEGGDVWKGTLSWASWGSVSQLWSSSQSRHLASLNVYMKGPNGGLHTIEVKLRVEDLRTAGQELTKAAEMLEAIQEEAMQEKAMQEAAAKEAAIEALAIRKQLEAMLGVEKVKAMFNAEKLEAMLSVEQLEALRAKFAPCAQHGQIEGHREMRSVRDFWQPLPSGGWRSRIFMSAIPMILHGPPVSHRKQRKLGIAKFIPGLGYEKRSCSRCFEHLWLGPTQLAKAAAEPRIEVICTPCVLKEFKTGIEDGSIVLTNLGGRGPGYYMASGRYYGPPEETQN